jgi:hypothetical protein
VLGTWQVRNGRYEVIPDTAGDTTALIPPVVSPTGQLRLAATLRTPSGSGFRKNAALIFDYHGPHDFKFVLMPTGADQWRMGHRDANGWQFLATFDDTLDANTDVAVAVELRGSVARLVVNGLAKLEFDFGGASLHSGRLGLGSNRGAAWFDEVTVEPLGDWQRFEYIEIAAASSAPVELGGWQLQGGMEMTFAPGTTLGPGEALVAVRFDPTDEHLTVVFRNLYAMDDTVQLVGPYTGELDNGGDVVRLVKPVDPTDPASGLILVDQIEFLDRAPWPTAADGRGATLHRASIVSFGNVPSSWTAATPTPGHLSLAVSGDMNRDGTVDGRDVAGFLLALHDPEAYAATFGQLATTAGDINGDGGLDSDDVARFVALVIAGLS